MPFKQNDPNINRKGRPTKDQAISDLLRSESLEIDPESGKTKREALVRVIYDRALNGERWACESIADRTEGKPIQTTTVTYRDPDEVIVIG